MAREVLRMTLDVEVNEPEELGPALARVRASRPGALVIGPDPLFFHQKEQLLAFARSTKVPARPRRRLAWLFRNRCF